MLRQRTAWACAAVVLGAWALLCTSASPPPIDILPPIQCVRVISGNQSAYREQAVAELLRVGFDDVSIQIEELDPGSHKRGCHNSHVRAHRWGVERNCRTLLVVEDDVIFANNIGPAWAALDVFMRTERDWDAVFLGYSALRIDPTQLTGVVRLQKPMLMHAVVFPLSTSRRIVAMPPWAPAPAGLSITEAYDVKLWYAGIVSNGFGLYPAVAGQRSGQTTSFSRDKNFILNWAKSLTGLGWINWLAYESCAPIYRYAGAASRLLKGVIDGADDWESTARVFTCV